MDKDEEVEVLVGWPHLFTRMFPLPYRLSFLVVLAIWGWGINLKYLYRARINVYALISYSDRQDLTKQSRHKSVYDLAKWATILLFFSIIYFWTLTFGQNQLAQEHQTVPNVTFFLILSLFLLPFVSAANGRQRLRRMLVRVSIGGLAGEKKGRFGDILLADVLTSFNKTIADMVVLLAMMLKGINTTRSTPDRMCGGWYLVPVVTMIPSVIRFIQCLTEFSRSRSNQDSGWQHLANALKYASAFPLIVSSALLRGRTPNDHGPGLAFADAFFMWKTAVLINSLYSFYWDVARDWDLTILSDLVSAGFRRDRLTKSAASSVLVPRTPVSTESSHSDHPFGLRKKLLFPDEWVYYAAVIVDFGLRIAPWALVLYSENTHLWFTARLEAGVFVMQLLEIFRRWIWIFFRVETEAVREVFQGRQVILHEERD